MTAPLRILMTGGGTGGHVYPAIAIADAIRALEPSAELVFAGTKERLEWEAVPAAGYPIRPINVQGLQRRLTAKNLLFPLRAAQGLAQSWRLVKELQPAVGVGTGGYVSGPVLLAASLQGVPIVVQEQNAYAGLTNRLLGRRAARVHVAFPEAMGAFPVGACMLSGNPTRTALVDVDADAARAHFGLSPHARVLLVLGGSLGSKALNDAIEALHPALLQQDDLHIVWQAGRRYNAALQDRVPGHPRLHLRPYIDQMPYAYAVADLALCRAGALTCSELMVTGTPALLVPSPNVTADHQTRNAQSMASAGAAILLPEANLQEYLLEQVEALLANDSLRQQMAEAAFATARPKAAQHIAEDVVALARRSPALKS